MKKKRNQTIMQLYVRVPYYTDTYYIFTTSSLLKLLYYEFLVKYHWNFSTIILLPVLGQNTKKKGGSVFIPFLWVTAYLTWPFCTFDAVSVRFVFNICQYLQYYITLNIILIDLLHNFLGDLFELKTDNFFNSYNLLKKLKLSYYQDSQFYKITL